MLELFTNMLFSLLDCKFIEGRTKVLNGCLLTELNQEKFNTQIFFKYGLSMIYSHNRVKHKYPRILNLF